MRSYVFSIVIVRSLTIGFTAGADCGPLCEEWRACIFSLSLSLSLSLVCVSVSCPSFFSLVCVCVGIVCVCAGLLIGFVCVLVCVCASFVCSLSSSSRLLVRKETRSCPGAPVTKPSWPGGVSGHLMSPR
jgi:hypothetical protein